MKNSPILWLTVLAAFYVFAIRLVPVQQNPALVTAVSPEARRLRDRLAKARQGPALPTAEYALALYEKAARGEINPARVNFRAEFAKAYAIVDALDQGRDPFAGKHGDLHKAYRSPVDRALQPYRIFIPAAYDGSKPSPLVVALHGMGGDENSMLDGYHQTLKREAERVGFIVAAPEGRGPESMYAGVAEQDVLDVLAQVERDYRIDSTRVYLMGHSMGGYGAWKIAGARPELFAALGSIAGWGEPRDVAKIRNIPEYVAHGDADRVVSIAESRKMVEAGKKIGANITYVEVRGGSHMGVAEPSFAPMLDFFAQQKRSDSPTQPARKAASSWSMVSWIVHPGLPGR